MPLPSTHMKTAVQSWLCQVINTANSTGQLCFRRCSGELRSHQAQHVTHECTWIQSILAGRVHSLWTSEIWGRGFRTSRLLLQLRSQLLVLLLQLLSFNSVALSTQRGLPLALQSSVQSVQSSAQFEDLGSPEHWTHWAHWPPLQASSHGGLASPVLWNLWNEYVKVASILFDLLLAGLGDRQLVEGVGHLLQPSDGLVLKLSFPFLLLRSMKFPCWCRATSFASLSKSLFVPEQTCH